MNDQRQRLRELKKEIGEAYEALQLELKLAEDQGYSAHSTLDAVGTLAKKVNILELANLKLLQIIKDLRSLDVV